MSQSSSVFISYRRSASGFLALAVYQDLSANGFDVFYDIESIDSGQFDTIILNQIAARPYFMPILTPGTLERCVERGDWLLREIAYALRTKRMFVPLHTPEFDFADIDVFLPTATADELKRYNAIEIPQRHFRGAMYDVRTRFLKPLDIPTKTVPENEVAVVARKLAKAASAPVVTDAQLAAVYGGADRTASELAIQRLKSELAELEKHRRKVLSHIRETQRFSRYEWEFILVAGASFLFAVLLYSMDNPSISLLLVFLSFMCLCYAFYYWRKAVASKENLERVGELLEEIEILAQDKQAEIERHQEIVRF